jgi:hypothetical protein
MRANWRNQAITLFEYWLAYVWVNERYRDVTPTDLKRVLPLHGISGNLDCFF